jgi:exodeoxyribonuclease V gamma subunit
VDPDWAWDGEQPDWLRHGGILPLGDAGDAAWAAEVNAVNKLSEVARATGRFDTRAGDGGQAVRIDVALGAGAESADAPLRITGLVRNVFPLSGSEAGLQVVFAFPKAKDAKGLKSADDLNFKDRVPAFLHWALLRLQLAAEARPVRLSMLAAEEPDLALEANAWDERYCAADAKQRAAMAEQLQHRVIGLIELWQRGRNGAWPLYPKAAWKAILKRPPPSAGIEDWMQAVAGDVAKAWVGGFTTGERDYAPGYAQLLEGDLVFGRADSDPGHVALRGLIEAAGRAEALIRMGAENMAQEAQP